LFALGVVAFLWTEANAGCAVIAGFQVCASWITGGSQVGLVKTQGFTPAQFAQSCNVTTNASPTEEFVASQTSMPASMVDLKLVGTVGTNCGLAPNNESCRIRGVVFCGPPDPSITMTLPLTAPPTDTSTFRCPAHTHDHTTCHP